MQSETKYKSQWFSEHETVCVEYVHKKYLKISLYGS